MPAQDGLRFLFDITDKITAKLVKIEAKAKSSAARIDKAFTRASKSQETSSLKLAALEQRRVIAAQSNAAKLAAIEQRRVAATQSNASKLAALEQRRTASSQANATKLSAIEQRRRADMQKSAERAVALAKRESSARTQSSAKTQAAAQKAHAKTVSLLKRESDVRARATAKSIANEQKRIVAVEKAHAKSVALLKRQSTEFKRSMGRMAAAAAVAFAVVAGKALQMASGYDAAMRSVQAKTGATGAVLDQLSEQAREMGRTTVHSATEAARGQAFLAQAGFDANEVLSALPGTLALATAGELELSRAADIASNVLTGFNLEVSEANRVADVLALTSQSTNTNVEQMGDAMKYAAAVASAADVDFEETAAAIGLLANAGFQGESGGTALRGAMSKLLNPTSAAQKVLDKLGISAVTSTGALRPLHDIVGQFEEVGLEAGDAMRIFGQRAGPGMLALVSQGSDALVNLTGELKNAEGTAQKTADIMGGGLWGAMKKIQSIVESAYISLGQRFGPAVEKLAKLFEKLPAPIQEVVVVVGSLAVAMGGLAVLMPQAFGSFTALPGKLLRVTKAFRLLNLTMLANPIGLVIAAVALLAGGLYLLFTKTEIGRQAFRLFGNYVKLYFTTAINLARAAIQWLAKWAVIVKNKIVQMIPKWVIKSVEWLGKKVAAVTGKIRELNERMEASAKQTEATAEVYEGLADVTVKVEKRTKVLLPVFKETGTSVKETAKRVENLTDGLEKQRRAVARLNPPLKQLDAHVKSFRKSQAEAAKEAETLNGRLEDQRRRLLGLPTDKAIQDFDELTRTWEGLHDEVKQGDVLKRYSEELENASKAGNTLDAAQIAIIESTKNAKAEASGYELALAGMAGQMGGATGKALNLVIAMREHNKAQVQAAAAGKKTEAQFGKMRMGAAHMAAGFSAIGEAIGGTAGIVLSELAGIADAFAKGGIVGGIMAGISALARGLASIFSRGKRKREAAEAAWAKEEVVRLELLGLAAKEVAEDFNFLRAVWAKMSVAERGRGMDNYVDALQAASDAGVVLTAVEQTLLDAFVTRNAAMKESTARQDAELDALTARQKAEMAGIDTQIDALESRLRPKISELESLLDSQEEKLERLKETQRKELAEMAAARAASLGVIEAAIHRELEDERIAAQLKIDLRKAGSDQEAIDAAHARAETSTERLLERDELDDLMKEAEARVRARYKDELDTINAHWDAKAAETAVRFNDELTEMESAHTEQLEALLASLKEQREVLANAHAGELADLQLAHAAQLVEIESYWDAAKAAHEKGIAAINAIPAATPGGPAFDPNLHGFTPGDHRQHGGPVSAGRSYVVGEAGPERFIPSRSGRIEPHGSSGGGVDAKALARAVADALEGTEIKVDGRKLGRLTVRHQPLAVAELGGRR